MGWTRTRTRAASDRAPVVDPCAHRCDVVQGLVLQVSRLTGQDQATVRVGVGLARDYVPLTPAPVCTGCTAVHPSPLAAAECCTTTTTGRLA